MSLIKQQAPAPVGEPERIAPEGAPVLDVVVPVYNEEDAIRSCIDRLHAHLTDSLPFGFRITIADNASTDSTLAIANELTEQYPAVRVHHLELKGRGRALRTVWAESDAQVLAYMDVDLSTDLAALLPLIAPLISGHSDVAIGTRLHRGSNVTRGAKREMISRSYNVILRRTLSARFSDAQCGFKAIRRDVAQALLPHVEDNGWFFDTELLVLAERTGLRIHEVPVDWIDDPDSSVHIVDTALEDLRGVWRIGTAFARGRIPLHDIATQLGRIPAEQPVDVPPGLLRQVVRFGAVGVLSTLAYAVLFVLTRGTLGPQLANALALLLTAIGNTQLNRRFTFAVRGSRGLATHQAQGLIVFGLALALTSGTLALLHATSEEPAHHVELAVLTIANAAATVMRFLLFRRWVFRH
ncbi:MAG: bifunctional glycosyltransferase family 2/GtrA family protein [Solirubrobacteraceae bacterium]|nr:bifunctional glycosyltransferase family 2/GtrA family protein [Solirubrobacteraceae bacterium]